MMNSQKLLIVLLVEMRQFDNNIQMDIIKLKNHK